MYIEKKRGTRTELWGTQTLRVWEEKEKLLRDQEGAPREVGGNPGAGDNLEAREVSEGGDYLSPVLRKNQVK